MPNWTDLLHPAAHAAIDTYRLDLAAGRQQPGARLAQLLAADAGPTLGASPFTPYLPPCSSPPAPNRTWHQFVADLGAGTPRRRSHHGTPLICRSRTATPLFPTRPQPESP